MNFGEFSKKERGEVFEILKSRETGLTEKEIEKLQKIYGSNEIKVKEVGTWDILIRQFKSAFFYLLFIAVLIYFLRGETINGVLILVFVFINVFLGFFQEWKAEKATQLLKTYLPQKIRVIREEKEEVIDKKFLVPGDIVLLEAGDIIPADLRVLKLNNFMVDESILTGESVPVAKVSAPLFKKTQEIFEAKNIAFAGTSVISGEGKGIVISTGKNTVFGEIAKLTTQENQKSIYEKNLLNFSKIILRTVIITILLVFLANVIIKRETGVNYEFLAFCIALIVGIIPEALPAVVTFAFSQGARKLAKEKVIVKRLSAIEDLGNIEILCTDKTGTLTENKLTLDEIFSQDKEKCLLFGLLSSAYMEEEIESVKSPFDIALYNKATEKIRNYLKNFKMVSEIPFNPFRQRNSVLFENANGEKILIVKGAPETILKISNLKAEEREEMRKKIEKEGKDGKRVLAVGFKNFSENQYSETDEKDLTFLGYFTFLDPLKSTAKTAIALAKKLGVEIKILTGDSLEVAGQVAKETGLISNPKEAILGENLNSLSKEEFGKKCFEGKVFARVSPETKFKIIETLQKKFEVGFLGEGINDVPALKSANVAIAVENAADVSREVSDIILLKKDLKAIIEGIKEGRNIFSNVNKYIKCTLASNFGNFYSIAAISLVIPFLPMLPPQILLVNLLSDFPLISVASDRIDVEELRKPKLYQLNQAILLIFLLALTSTIFDFIFFGIFRKVEPAILQTLWFIESILTEIALIFSIRTRHFFLKTKRPSFILIFLAIFAFLITLIIPFTNFGRQFFHFSSPPLSFVLIVVSLVFGYFFISEMVKLIYFSYFKPNQTAK